MTSCAKRARLDLSSTLSTIPLWSSQARLRHDSNESWDLWGPRGWTQFAHKGTPYLLHSAYLNSTDAKISSATLNASLPSHIAKICN